MIFRHNTGLKVIIKHMLQYYNTKYIENLVLIAMNAQEIQQVNLQNYYSNGIVMFLCPTQKCHIYSKNYVFLGS